MFEVIISQVRSGKVERRAFGTRDEAEQYVARREEKLLYGRGGKNRSLRDYRMEIHRREPAAPLALPAAAAA